MGQSSILVPTTPCRDNLPVAPNLTTGFIVFIRYRLPMPAVLLPTLTVVQPSRSRLFLTAASTKAATPSPLIAAAHTLEHGARRRCDINQTEVSVVLMYAHRTIPIVSLIQATSKQATVPPARSSRSFVYDIPHKYSRSSSVFQ